MVWNFISSQVVPAAVGAIFGLGVYYFQFRYRRKTERTRLRRALYSEIATMDGFDTIKELLGRHEDAQYFLTHHDFTISVVYEANVDRLGLLTQEEIEAVVNYYSNVLRLREELKALEKVIEDQDTTHKQGGSALQSTKSTVEALENLRKPTMKVLSKHLDGV